MNKKFLNDASKIINELNNIEELPSDIQWNDKRAVAPTKETKQYENSKKGEILQKLDETTDIKERKILIEELKVVNEEKKVEIKSKLENCLEEYKVNTEKRLEEVKKGIERIKNKKSKLLKIIESNEKLMSERSGKTAVYKAAADERKQSMKNKEKYKGIEKKLLEKQKVLNNELNEYNEIDFSKDGIEKIKVLLKDENVRKEEKDNEKSITQTEQSRSDESKENDKDKVEAGKVNKKDVEKNNKHNYIEKKTIQMP